MIDARVELEGKDAEKFEELKEFVEEKTGKYSKAGTLREAVRIAHKKVGEWEDKENEIVKKDYNKLKREIEKTLEGK